MFSSYITSPDRFLARSHLVQVKSKPIKAYNTNWDNLSKSIWDKFIANQQTEKKFRDKMMLWKDLSTYIKITNPEYELFITGSTMNGFGSNESDVDMCLTKKKSARDSALSPTYHLNIIFKLLHKCDFINSIELVRAKVPILKFHDRKRNLMVDLNCNHVTGIRNTHLLHCYSEIDYRVRPLVLIVKLWAKAHGINNPRLKTISSYSLALMVIHFLQCGTNPPVLPCLQELFPQKFCSYSDIYSIDIHEELHIESKNMSLNQQSLGELLIQFFKYYSTFEFGFYIISVGEGRKIEIPEYIFDFAELFKPIHLIVRDPFEPKNTAYSVHDYYKFFKIREIISKSYGKLNKTGNLNSIFT